MKKYFDQLAALRADNQSGALELLEKLLELLEGTLRERSFNGTEISAMLSAVRQLKQNHNQLVILHHFIDQLSATDQPSLLAQIQDYRTIWARIDETIARQFLEKVDLTSKTVLVHSNSQTVTALFREAKKQGIHCSIFQTESRPGLEGRIQATRIAALGFPVTLIADAAVTLYMPDIDMAILGADSLGEDHFVNKIGSHSIALACREKQKPAYVLADERKKASRRVKEVMKPGEEIWDAAGNGLKVENYYFESIPCGLISSFFTGKKNQAS